MPIVPITENRVRLEMKAIGRKGSFFIKKYLVSFFLQFIPFFTRFIPFLIFAPQ